MLTLSLSCCLGSCSTLTDRASTPQPFLVFSAPRDGRGCQPYAGAADAPELRSAGKSPPQKTPRSDPAHTQASAFCKREGSGRRQTWWIWECGAGAVRHFFLIRRAIVASSFHPNLVSGCASAPRKVVAAGVSGRVDSAQSCNQPYGAHIQTRELGSPYGERTIPSRVTFCAVRRSKFSRITGADGEVTLNVLLRARFLLVWRRQSGRYLPGRY